MAWTTHGFQIIGTIALDPVINDRPRVARCDGPGSCGMCSTESVQMQQSMGLDEFGQPNIPVLDSTAPIDRMLGRVRMAMIMTRPMSEVDAITEHLAVIIAEHKVLMEQHGINAETLKKLDE